MKPSKITKTIKLGHRKRKKLNRIKFISDNPTLKWDWVLYLMGCHDRAVTAIRKNYFLRLIVTLI